MTNRNPACLHIVSHTHWDREWYMPFQVFRRRFVEFLDGVIEEMSDEERFSHFLLDGQVLVLKDYLELFPERKEKIAALVRAGRLDIGPWYTQPNVFMVSGESLVRNLLLGFRECRELGGGMKICYLPDCFGFNSQLPQIIRGFDMEDVVIWRGVRAGTKTLFRWEGADRSQVYAHYMVGGYINGMGLSAVEEDHAEVIDFTPIARTGLIRQIQRSVARIQQRSPVPEFLLMNGADHQFVQKELKSIIDRIRNLFPENEVLHSSLPLYVQRAKDFVVSQKVALDTEVGELRDPAEGCILPGSQSTRADVKQASRLMETVFAAWLEPFAALCWLCGSEYPQAFIWKAWEYLLQNQTHDSLACASVDATYHQVLTRFEWAWELAEDIIESSLLDLIDRVEVSRREDEASLDFIVFNPSNWRRSGLVSQTIDIPTSLGIRRPVVVEGQKKLSAVWGLKQETLICKFNPYRGLSDWIPVDRFHVCFKAEDIPPLGYKAFAIAGERSDPADGSADAERIVRTPTEMENEFLRVTFNPNGTFDLLAKDSGQCYRGLHDIRDRGEAGNGFEHVPPEIDTVLSTAADGLQATITVAEDNPVFGAITVHCVLVVPDGLTQDRRARRKETVQLEFLTTVTLARGERRVDMVTVFENQASDHLVEVLFPTGLHAEHYHAEQPFDAVRRAIRIPDPEVLRGGHDPELVDVSDEPPAVSQPQLGFIDVSDEKQGLMIANKGLISAGVLDDPSRTIAMTLLRCTDRLYRSEFADCADLRIPEAQCLKRFSFEYSIIPHEGNWENGLASCREFQLPLRGQTRRTPLSRIYDQDSAQEKSLPDRFAFLEMDCGHVEVTTVKKCEHRQSLIVRIVNIQENGKTVRFRVNSPARRFTAAFSCSLNENRLEPIPLDTDGWIEIALGAKKIATIELAE